MNSSSLGVESRGRSVTVTGRRGGREIGRFRGSCLGSGLRGLTTPLLVTACSSGFLFANGDLDLSRGLSACTGKSSKRNFLLSSGGNVLFGG